MGSGNQNQTPKPFSLFFILLLCCRCFLLHLASAQCHPGDLSALSSLNLVVNSSVNCCELAGISCDHRDERIIGVGIETTNPSIPLQICNLSFVEQINITYEVHNGEIAHVESPFPDCLCDVQTLTLLRFVGFRITGGIPSCMSNFKSLQLLDLHSNGLTGGLPDEIGNLTELSVLNLSVNSLGGKIPESVGKLRNLQSLDLSINRFADRIPTGLSNLAGLHFLNLSRNNLSSNPEINRFLMKFPNSSFEGNPLLRGSVGEMEQLKDFGGLSSKGKIVLACSVAGAFLVLGFWFIYYALTHQKTNSTAVTKVLPRENTRFGSQELWASTQGYHLSNLIASIGCFSVYRGTLLDGQTVGICKMEITDTQVDDSDSTFAELLEILTEVRHRNLIRTIGYCSSPDCKAFVTEYMGNGTLDMHLHRYKSGGLSFESRLNVALGIARALTYLHHERDDPILHLQLDPSCILIDDNLQPIIYSFGLVHFQQICCKISPPTSNAYSAPELLRSDGVVSSKADVYSYGIIVLELLTSKKPGSENADNDLACWVRSKLVKEGDKVFDPVLFKGLGSKQRQKLMRVLGLALLCTRKDAYVRPTMGKVLEILINMDARIDHVILEMNTKFLF